jgi:hypothetical protein
MKQENYTKALVIVFSFLFLIVCLSGCTSNQNTNENTLSGIWIGNVQLPAFSRIGNTTVSKIMFSGDTVEMTLNSDLGTFTTNYTYSINGATLVLEPQFTGRSGFPGRPRNNGTSPGNWTRPSTNETWPINGTIPYNDTRPGNWTRPENETGNPGVGSRSLSISFTYSLNEDRTVLYLNGAEFRKMQ